MKKSIGKKLSMLLVKMQNYDSSRQHNNDNKTQELQKCVVQDNSPFDKQNYVI